MYLKIDIPCCGKELEAPCELELYIDEEIQGDEKTGSWSVGEVCEVEIPVEYEAYRQEIEENINEMLKSGELDEKAKESAEAI